MWASHHCSGELGSTAGVMDGLLLGKMCQRKLVAYIFDPAKNI